jgi:hypothetical protein
LYVLRDQPKKRQPKLLNQRLLASFIVGLLISNLGGYGWYRHSLLHRETTQIHQRQDEQIAQCNLPLQSQESGTRSISVELIATAKTINFACKQIIQQGMQQEQPTFSQADALRNQGRALLLLSRSSASLQQETDAMKNLGSAKSAFEALLKLDPTDPQAHFYLGFTKQLMKESYDATYQDAIKHYLSDLGRAGGIFTAGICAIRTSQDCESTL